MRMLSCDLVRALLAFTAFGLAASPPTVLAADRDTAFAGAPSLIPLPPPRLVGTTSVEAALASRRSLRAFASTPVALEELSQLLWAAQGITHSRGYRTAPSAGALYPLELIVVAGTVTGLPAGTYRYEPDGHRLVPVAGGDLRSPLADAALGQSAVRKAPVVIAVVAHERKTTVKYGERGVRYVHLEAGHAAQNLCLQASALGLGTVLIGAFSDKDVASLLGSQDLQPLYLIPLGRK